MSAKVKEILRAALAAIVGAFASWLQMKVGG